MRNHRFILIGGVCLWALAATGAGAQTAEPYGTIPIQAPAPDAYGTIPTQAAAAPDAYGTIPIQGNGPSPSFASGLNGLRYEFGVGAYTSFGRSRFTLKDMGNRTALSRLTWSGETATAGEIFGRIDHASGVFLKGAAGLTGAIGSGKLQDEDFPAAVGAYSSTTSAQRGGKIGYGNIDLGYDLVRKANWNLGGFLGYQYLADASSAYGCTQTASNPAICQPGQVPPGQKGLSDSQHWNALRVGLIGQYYVIPALRLTGEVAYLPYVSLNADDLHVLRQGQPGGFNGATPASGVGQGVQLEAKVDYAIKDWWTVGLGARYLNLNASGVARFDQSAIPAGNYAPQGIQYETSRLGVFANTGLKF